MLVDCPWVKNGKFCNKKGYLVLEKPRKKKINRYYSRTNEKHKEYDSSARPRGRYFRVHHYMYEKGKRNSYWHYIGNTDRHVQRLKAILEINPSTIDSKYQQWVEELIKKAEDIDNSDINQELVDFIWMLKCESDAWIIKTNGREEIARHKYW